MTPYESFLLIKNGSSNLKQLALITFINVYNKVANIYNKVDDEKPLI